MVKERTLQLEAAQKALVQKEKLKTLGAIAADVAHEIRNPLMSVIGFAMHLQKKFPDLPEVGIVLEESRCLEKILDRIREYLIPVEMRSRECPLNTVVAESVGLLAPDLEREGWSGNRIWPPICLPRWWTPDILAEVFIYVITHTVKVKDNQGVLTIRTDESEQDIQIDFRSPVPAEKSPKTPNSCCSLSRKAKGLAECR